MIEWWGNIIFAERWALWLLLLVPVIAVTMFLISGKGRPVLKLSSFRYLQGIPVPAKVKWKNILYVIRLLALAVLIMTFARPQSRAEWKRKTGKGIDIMICMDISSSMNATDLDPKDLTSTRLDVAKKAAMNFVDRRPNDRIGLVVFCAETFTPCPLTTDHRALKTIIQNANNDNDVLADGTQIGMGLAKSVERISESTAKSKVVVLLTDGKNGGGTITPLDAGKLAKTYNVRVYTIGLGTANGKALTPYARNSDGSLIKQYMDVDLDESELIKIAEMNGGKYFRATDSKRLEEIYSEISKLETSEYDKKDKEQRKEEFLPFILVALGLLSAEYFLRYTVFDSLT